MSGSSPAMTRWEVGGLRQCGLTVPHVAGQKFFASPGGAPFFQKRSAWLAFVRPVIVVAGPTASGKSALALEIAVRLGGTVINADAMQCYRELRVVTARPSEADEAAAEHRLYGVRAAVEPANAAWWRGAALRRWRRQNCRFCAVARACIFRLCCVGIAEIPAPGAAARAQARGLLAELGPAGCMRG